MNDKLLTLRPNRAALAHRLEGSIRRADACGAPLALLVARFQRGVELTALHGADWVDRLLDDALLRASEVCRPEDRVARTGDLELALVLEGLHNPEHAQLAAGKLLRVLSSPFRNGSDEFAAGWHIGIAVHPGHAGKPEALLRCAEAALVDAENQGVACRVYDRRASVDNEDRWALEQELHDALRAGEFEVHLQPKIDLRTGRVAGAEALLRWRSPTRGMVPPDQFIPVAARCGLIKPLTWSSLNMALEQAAGWPDRFGPLSLAVNLSPVLLEDEAVVRQFTDSLAIWGVAPERVVVEITESAAMRDPESGFEAIRAFRAAGLKVSIDDFGTGYSSFAQFRRIPANEIKVDRSFVAAMRVSPADAGIVRSIVTLAQAVDLEIVAEGVEDAATLQALTALGCQYAQGYCISAALPAAEFVRFVIDWEAAARDATARSAAGPALAPQQRPRDLVTSMSVD